MVIPFDAILDTGDVVRINASDELPKASICRLAVSKFNRQSVGHRRARKVVELDEIVARF
jgi:hypothetical protein